jgi:hypothetical protein
MTSAKPSVKDPQTKYIKPVDATSLFVRFNDPFCDPLGAAAPSFPNGR